METIKGVWGPEHPNTLTSMNNIAFTRKGQGKAEQAVALVEDYLRYRANCMGINHAETQSSLEAFNQWREEGTD